MDSDYKVERPTTDGTLSTSAPQSQKDDATVEPPQQTTSSSTNKPNKRKSQSKNRKRKGLPPYKPAYLDVIQQQIDDLKQEARHTYEIQARQNLEGELVDDEKTVAEQRMAASSLIDKLEELKIKLDTPDMLHRSANENGVYNYRPSNDRKQQQENDHVKETADFQQETLTLLHFFYIVRLAQKGFFTLISQKYPNVEPNALIHLCDKLVGSSLFVVKDPKEHVRSTKRNQVFGLLRKLHDGASESIGDGFVTTFEQVRHLIYDFIGSTATTQDNKVATTIESPLQENENATLSTPSLQQQPPVWIVVPFNGMMDQLQQQGAPSLSNRTLKEKPTDDESLKTSATESTNISNGNIPSATNDAESTTQLNGSITPDVEQKDEKQDHVETTNDTLENRVNQEKKTTRDDDTSSRVEPVPDTTTTNAPPSVKESLEEDETALHTDTAETVDTIETITSVPTTTTTTTTTTTIDSINSSTTTNKEINTEEPIHNEEEASSSGWGTPPSSLATASSAWTKGILPEKQESQQQQQQQQEEVPKESQQVSAEVPAITTTTTTTTTESSVEDVSSNNGWGSPVSDSKSPPAWEGKLPDDVVTPGDETISGDLDDSQWQSVSDYDKRRPMGSGGGRGRPSGNYRGGPGSGFGQGRGGRGYRSYGDGRSGGGSGMRRGPGGNANAGWSKARTPRPE